MMPEDIDRIILESRRAFPLPPEQTGSAEAIARIVAESRLAFPANQAQAGKSTPSALPPLCPEQEEALGRILKTDKRATILTGQAGTGKSVLVRTMLQRHPDLFTLTSTTARSALHIGGVTVDSLFSIVRRDWAFRNAGKMEKRLLGLGPFIVIDEASMVGTGMAELPRARTALRPFWRIS